MIQEIIQSSSPEVKLILNCARKNFGLDQVENTRSLMARGISWNRVLQLTETYRVTNLVYSNLKQHFLNQIPLQIRQGYKNSYHFSLAHNLALSRELFTLLDSLRDANVDVIPYKGTFLTLDLYGDLGKRSFNDIDIIVKRSDIARVEPILGTLGYMRTWPKGDVPDFIRQTHLRQKYNLRYLHKNSQTVLELHWGVLPGYLLSPDLQGFFWETAVPRELAGRTTLYFDNEAYLSVLCAHGANHCWLYVLNFICDISEYIRTHIGLNWERLFLVSRQIKLDRVVGLGLWLAHHVLDAEVPPRVLEIIARDDVTLRLGEQAALHLFHFRTPRHFYIPRFQLALCEGYEKKLRYVWSLIEPSEKDHDALPLPAALTWIYYLLRPFRLIREHAGLPAEPE